MDAVQVLSFDHRSPELPIIKAAGSARAVVWPGAGAPYANMNYVVLEPGEENVPHIHAESEDTILCLEGKGTVNDLTNARRLQFEAGQAIHVPAGVEHAVMADRGERVVSVGGPCPPDWALLRLLGVE